MTRIGLLAVDVVLVSPGGVTAPELDAAVDLPLGRTGDGAVWTPPTSLAGSLRAHLGDRAARWLGSDPPEPGRSSDQEQLTPSRLRFLGSTTVLATPVEVRRSTAIDPERAAAATATLRAAEIAPAGSTVTLYLRIDEASRDELAELATELGAWQPVIGRGRSYGYGRSRVCRVAWRMLDLGTREGLRLWLTSGLFPADGWDQVETVPAPQAKAPELDLRFLIAAALHIGSGGQAAGDGETNRAPIVLHGGKPVIPGTTWKGLLRSRCGYILRSCGRSGCLAPSQPACGTCLLCELFGWTGKEPGPGQPIGHVGRLTFADSPIDADVTHRNHVGIDRFTGGARRAVLFEDEVVAAGELALHVTSVEPLRPAERGLLLLAVRDLHDGLIGVGRGSTRGYGSLRLAAHSQPVLQELEPSHPTGAATVAMLRGEQP